MGRFYEMTHICFCLREREGEKEVGVGDYRGGIKAPPKKVDTYLRVFISTNHSGSILIHCCLDRIKCVNVVPIVVPYKI